MCEEERESKDVRKFDGDSRFFLELCAETMGAYRFNVNSTRALGKASANSIILRKEVFKTELKCGKIWSFFGGCEFSRLNT